MTVLSSRSSLVLEQTLASTPLFRQLSPLERSEILGLVERRPFAAGETVLREGDQSPFLGVVVSGTCEVIKTDGQGHTLQLALLEAGAVFGEMSFFQGGPHSATVRARTSVEAVLLSRERYDLLVRTDAVSAYKLAFNVVGILADRLRRMDQWTAELVGKTGHASHHEEWKDFQTRLYTGWNF
jgi:CRP/FNR family transcriptional regulator, cyclic AMP receptor protein